jgi:acyl carrier protein
MDMMTDRYTYVYETAGRIVSDYLRLKPGELRPESHIVDDCGADSLALVELGFQISETFGVPMADTSGNKLIFRNLVEFILEHMPGDRASSGAQ